MALASNSVYLASLHRALPRLLSSFNFDPTSKLHGVGDRFHWGWKLIDFPNGTFQGAAHGLALLIDMDALPDTLTEKGLLTHINRMIRGLELITAANGSLDEALPNEASFCVTALVAADILAALDILETRLPPDERQLWLRAVNPLVDFLLSQDEHHGMISNHLASAALAVYRWHAVTGDERMAARGSMWVDRILRSQSTEGWFSEYGGADPGYQSWCTTQLAQLHLLRPDLELGEPLSRSLAFLALAAHPDGSFGGSYGWRNTRFLLPGGVTLLADMDANAAALSAFAVDSISRSACVTLDCMDAGNLVPFFNDYALAAWGITKIAPTGTTRSLPYQSVRGRTCYPEAGWLIDSGHSHYSIINMKRGGASAAFHHGARIADDPGVVVKDEDGHLYSSQLSAADAIPNSPPTENELCLSFSLQAVDRPQSGPFGFILLRIASLTLFRSLRLGNLIKRMLANFLINKRSSPAGRVTRCYRLGSGFSINDHIEGLNSPKPVANPRHFSAIHMASQGYWQRGDEETLERDDS